MLLSSFPICFFLYTVFFTTTSTDAMGIKDIWDFFISAAGLDDGNTSNDPFDPSYMDNGDFKKENNPVRDKANCFVEDGLAAVIQQCDFLTSYRTYDGTCNNLMFPTWGRAGDCHTRLLQGSYKGKSGIRESVKGGSLPPPRDLVLQIFTDSRQPSPNISFLFTVFGQMVAHDMSLTNKQTVIGSCCSKENAKKTSKCAPFYYPPYDPYFSKFNVTCQDFVRSEVCPICLNAKRQQPNEMTATVDGSIIYGTSKEKATRLRAMDGTGRMNCENINGGELLPRPKEQDNDIEFCSEGQKQICFNTGDVRVNQHSPLTAIETLFLREHNRIAGALARFNPSWDGETLYQEARKIVGAEFQNIIYSEYLPLLVGPAHMAYYNLTVLQKDSTQSSSSNPNAPPPSNQGTQYKPLVRLGIWNEFSTAIFRLHSMVPSRVGLDPRRLMDYFSNPAVLRSGQMDSILLGTCKVPSETSDRYFVEDISNHFIEDTNAFYGIDLVSTDLQRARDHGIPTYSEILKFLTDGKMKVKNFEDLSPIMSESNINLLRNSYKDVRDVDLFAGAIMENHVPNSNLGPTACSIVSLQFNNVKFGDRFYFEHENEVPSFSPAQRESLKTSSLARILCDNTGIQTIQRNPMLLESAENPLVDCSKIPSLDLSLWQRNLK